MSPLAAVSDFDARVQGRITLENLAHVRPRRSIIDEAQFPILVGLRADALDHSAQDAAVGVVNRRENGHQWSLRKACGDPAHALDILRANAVMVSDPDAISIRVGVGERPHSSY